MELGTRKDYIVDPAIVITGYPCDKWDEVQAIQDQPFIYIMYNGHGRNDPDDLQYLLDLIGREQLDDRLAPFYIENPRVGVRVYDEDNNVTTDKWTDGDRMYEADDVYRFHGGFLNYSHAFGIDTNHRSTIKTFIKAIEGNIAKDWDNTEPIPDVLTSREKKYYSIASAVERWDEIDEDRKQIEDNKQSRPRSKSKSKSIDLTPTEADDL